MNEQQKALPILNPPRQGRRPLPFDLSGYHNGKKITDKARKKILIYGLEKNLQIDFERE